MAIGMFSLDRGNPRFFTCCGRIHIKMALLFLIVLIIGFELLEAAIYIFSDSADISTFKEVAIEVIEYIVTVTMMVAFFKEWAVMLVPFICQMFVFLTLMLLNVAQIVFCIFAPYSEMANLFFGGTEFSFVQREKFLLFLLAIMAVMTTFAGWCLHVGLCSYQYFEGRDAERRTKESRPPVSQRPPLVQPSFANPNFSLEDDGDEVLPKKTNGTVAEIV